MSSGYLAEIRFTFAGLTLRQWYSLHSPDGGSWSVDIETTGKLNGSSYISATNENNLHPDENGNLTGDDPSANLYADILINPVDELPLETYIALQSGDYANLHRTFTHHLP
jgi:hypothetical protein